MVRTVLPTRVPPYGRRLSRCLAGLTLGWVAAVAGEELRLPSPGQDSWRVLTFPKVARQTLYTPAAVDGRAAVRAESACSASALYFAPGDIDLRRTPHLSWEWRVDRGFDVADERIMAGDDFAARVYATFRFEPVRASWWQRVRHAVGSRTHGYELPGSALNYVWSTDQPAGQVWDNPFASESKMISRGAGALGEWRREEVDVAADYRRLFAREPPALVAVVVMSDSDNTCQEAVAYFASFRFSGP